MKPTKRRHQPRVKGGRLPLPSCVVGAIEHKVRAIAERHSVSRSWVAAVLMADALGIDIPHYQETKKS